MRRREFTRAVGDGLAVCVSGTATSNATGRRAKRPNFISILADDLGFGDLESYGAEIETPHLDGLARDGNPMTACSGGI